MKARFNNHNILVRVNINNLTLFSLLNHSGFLCVFLPLGCCLGFAVYLLLFLFFGIAC